MSYPLTIRIEPLLFVNQPEVFEALNDLQKYAENCTEYNRQVIASYKIPLNELSHVVGALSAVNQFRVFSAELPVKQENDRKSSANGYDDSQAAQTSFGHGDTPMTILSMQEPRLVTNQFPDYGRETSETSDFDATRLMDQNYDQDHSMAMDQDEDCQPSLQNFLCAGNNGANTFTHGKLEPSSFTESPPPSYSPQYQGSATAEITSLKPISTMSPYDSRASKRMGRTQTTNFSFEYADQYKQCTLYVDDSLFALNSKGPKAWYYRCQYCVMVKKKKLGENVAKATYYPGTETVSFDKTHNEFCNRPSPELLQLRLKRRDKRLIELSGRRPNSRCDVKLLNVSVRGD